MLFVTHYTVYRIINCYTLPNTSYLLNVTSASQATPKLGVAMGTRLISARNVSITASILNWDLQGRQRPLPPPQIA